MKIPYTWLAEFVDLPDDPREVGERLSLSGLECAGVDSGLPGLDGVVVGEVLSVEPHPDADKLTVCRVEVGDGRPRQIVCGAPNVSPGMKAPVAPPGASLPDGTTIEKARLRGVESEGMLCSARELGLGDDHSGLLALEPGAFVGSPVSGVLGGDEPVIEIEITPNRGDALSILGVARDLSAVLDTPLRQPDSAAVDDAIADVVDVSLDAPEACPVFAGRVIRGLDPDARTPLWMRERLRRSGIRPVSPAVDVTQYVMLELGQPMHAYDLERLAGTVRARWARPGETLELLDGSRPQLEQDMLVIADDRRVLGLAGIMGGGHSAVQANTRDIFLESAFFAPRAIQGRGRRLGLQTDASYRFERGVDFASQGRAIERATALILEIAGGTPGPTRVQRDTAGLPGRPGITLTRERLDALLGIRVPEEAVTGILDRLELAPWTTDDGWRVQPPSFRFDLEIEEDLVEEVGRVYGYEHIPARQFPVDRPMNPIPENRVRVRRLKEALVDRGYQEVITYSFVDEALQRRLTGHAGLALANPITAEMTHMRRTLWAGLLETLRYNRNRQNERVRIFECGLRFIEEASDIEQEMVIAGLVSGALYPEQWGAPGVSADFHDVKGDIEALCPVAGPGLDASPEHHPALHPGRSARLRLDGEALGWLGAIHPKLAAELEVPRDTLLFELHCALLQGTRVPELRPISRFPAVRRDLALVVPEEVGAGTLVDAARDFAGPELRELVIFDVYRGKELESGTKSLAMGLIFQQLSRTLKDKEVDALVTRVLDGLGKTCGARLRE